MKFTREQLEECLQVVLDYGNADDIRSKKFADFVCDSYADEMGASYDSPSDFIRICIEVFRDLDDDAGTVATRVVRD